jgi:hypothetical protein
MGDKAKNKSKNETIKSTDIQSEFQSEKQDLLEIFQDASLDLFSFNYSSNSSINANNFNADNIFNNYLSLISPNNETERNNMEVESQKEEENNSKEEKSEKKEEKSEEKKNGKKRKRSKKKEKSENIEIIPKKKFKIEKKNIGYKTKKKSKRESNQLDMFKRNFIQDICIDYINEGEADKNKRLSKLDPIIFSGDDFKQKTLKEIYSQKITIKEIDKNHNINIINNAIGLTKMKLCLGFKDALKFFFNEYFEEKELLQIFQNLKENNDVSEEISYKGFIKGLKGAKEYLKERGGNEVYSKKLENSLNKFREKYLL